MAIIHDDKSQSISEFPEVSSKRVMPTKVQESALPSGAATSAKQLADDHNVTVSNPTTDPETGLATSVKQDDIITELGQKVEPADIQSTTPTVYNVTLTDANTEYSQALPANTREFRFRCRTLYDCRYAYVTGKVATPTAPYLTLPAGSDFWSDWTNLASQTLFLASSTVGVVIELECWV